MIDQEDHTVSVRAEQAVLGALLADNGSLDRIGPLETAHFYRAEHRLIFEELRRQIGANQTADAITIHERLAGKVDECMRYCAVMRQSAVTGSRIKEHADIVVQKAKKRALVALGMEIQEMAASSQDAELCVDHAASKLEELGRAVVEHDPQLLCDMMADYARTVEDRFEGRIKPVATGLTDLDALLDGGLERGTLAIAAGRPSMGKTAFGLNLARNVAGAGAALFLSMEMPRHQVNDRNVAAIGHIPLPWLKKPGGAQGPDTEDAINWSRFTSAMKRSRELKLFIDDETGLNLMRIRAKARRVKRANGGKLDLVVIDQLSFITGGKGDRFELTGEYTRGLVALAKELDCVVLLLCQLNRKCEERPNKRPMLSDLAQSGSIEQDGAYVMFLYRDEVYNQDTPDAGIAEIIVAKQRQGRVGTARAAYIGDQTRFEDLAAPWMPRIPRTAPAPALAGFD